MQTRDSNRLRELILYVAAKMERDRHAGIGRIKMAKLLWRIDFSAYWLWGRSISGATYHADKLGPAPIEELLATRDLEEAGRFHWQTDWDRRWYPVVIDSPDMTLFTPDEIQLIDRTVDQYRSTSGGQMVDDAHEFPGWINAWRGGAGKGNTIPYESVFWDRRRTVREAEERRAAELGDAFRHLIDR